MSAIPHYSNRFPTTDRTTSWVRPVPSPTKRVEPKVAGPSGMDPKHLAALAALLRDKGVLDR